MRLPNGPTQHPMMQLSHWLLRPVPWLEDCEREFGPMFTARWAGFAPHVFVSDPELLRTVFAAPSDTLRAGPINKMLRPLIGERSLMSMDGAEHAARRRVLLRALAGARPYFVQVARDCLHERIDGWKPNRKVELLQELQEFTLDVIVRAALGVRSAQRRAEIIGAYKALVRRLMSAATFLKFNFVNAAGFARGPRLAFDALIYEEIERCRRGENDSRSIVQMLLAPSAGSEAGLDAESLRNEVVTLLAAGSETTATALTWCVERVLRHPRVHGRLLDELQRAERRGLLAAGREGELEYLDAVIHEALRQRPVTPSTGRKVVKPFALGGFELHAGTTLVPCIYLAQRNACFGDPDVFDPERFVQATPPPPYTWLPFGGGARRCLGMGFAMDELRIGLSAIIARTTLQPCAPRDDMRRRWVTLVPSSGATVRVRTVRPRPHGGCLVSS